MLGSPQNYLKKTAAMRRLKELAVLGGGNPEPETLSRSYGVNRLPLVKKCNTLVNKLQYFSVSLSEFEKRLYRKRSTAVKRSVERFTLAIG
jgi:hypothetical protein